MPGAVCIEQSGAMRDEQLCHQRFTARHATNESDRFHTPFDLLRMIFEYAQKISKLWRRWKPREAPTVQMFDIPR
jgi:hypothetical protein